MKNLFLLIFIFNAFVVLATQKVNKLEIGDKAVLTDVQMLSTSGENVSLNDIKEDNGTLVIFSCNTCPFVLRWEGRYSELKELSDRNNVGMIVLNSNYKNRDGNDSFEEMKKHALEKNYDFHYVVDKESKIANAFGGQTTPHVFLFDGNNKLAYKGAIDDNSGNASEVKKAFLKEAIKSLGKSEKIAVAETPPQGCSIKRKLD